MTRKILIVDDEVHIRTLLEQTLEEVESAGVEIHVAFDGVDGLAKIEEERPDLVFLDAMMPRMSGYDVCRKVKHELGIEDVYIVMLTAKGQAVDREDGYAAGADVFATKPFDPDEIVSIAEGVLQLN